MQQNAGTLGGNKNGKIRAKAEEYANHLVTASVEESDYEDVVRKVTADLQGHVTSEEIRQKRAALLPSAQEQILSEAE